MNLTQSTQIEKIIEQLEHEYNYPTSGPHWLIIWHLRQALVKNTLSLHEVQPELKFEFYEEKKEEIDDDKNFDDPEQYDSTDYPPDKPVKDKSKKSRMSRLIGNFKRKVRKA